MIGLALLPLLALAAPGNTPTVPSSVADAMAIGDCRAVLTSLPNPTRDSERLLVGTCLHKTNRPEEASAVLAKIASTGVYKDYGRWVRAQALADARRPTEALAVLHGLKLPGDLGLEVRLLRDRLLVESGRPAEAVADLKALATTRVADEARFWAAAGAEKRGDKTGSLLAYGKVWSSSTRGPWASRAAERLALLKKAVPEARSAAGRTLIRSRIASLQRDQQHTAALALYDMLWAVEPPTTPESIRDMAEARFDAHDYAGAREAFARVLGSAESANGGPADLFDYALTTARTRDYDQAAAIYRRLILQHPTSDKADFAAFKLGYMEFDRGNFEAARREFAKYRSTRVDAKHLDEALWFSGWAAWRLEQRDAAVSDFSVLLNQFPKSALAPAAAYWTARSLGLAGKLNDERQALQTVVDRWPTSGHAWFASTRLSSVFPKHPTIKRPAWPAPFNARAEVKRGEALLELGLRPWARREFTPLVPLVKANRPAALAAAHALLAADDAITAYKVIAPYCASPWIGGDPVVQQACTPRLDGSITDAMAAKYSLPTTIPFGIMTAESGLDPKVTSLAGARGLMQLMPGLAETLHEELFPARAFDADDLYAAPYNAALGTAELGRRWASLDGLLTGSSIPAVIASYNGGEEAVRRWAIASGGKPEFDEFAENIGYTETRQYVRRVLGFIMTYRWVYGDP